MQLTLERLPRVQQLAFNRQRWADLLADKELARHEFRVETNGAGQILMTPPAAGSHSSRQGEITFRLRKLLGGQSLPECPVSTLDSVRAVDVGWFSDSRYEQVKGQIAFETAPEICVEVISPSNSHAEMNDKDRAENKCLTPIVRSPRRAGSRQLGSDTFFPLIAKRQLYFDAGASEVWFCHTDGHMEFFLSAEPTTARPCSKRCPDFPESVSPA